MIMLTRRRIIAAARALREKGEVPPTVDRPDIYRRARGGSFIAPSSLDWLDAYAKNLREATSPLGMLMAEAAE